MEHVAAATVAEQLSVPSLTVTVPVGVPLAGATAATVKLNATACPTPDRLGVWDVIVVAVLALLTTSCALPVLPKIAPFVVKLAPTPVEYVFGAIFPKLVFRVATPLAFVVALPTELPFKEKLIV